jgi:hypothetical protein
LVEFHQQLLPTQRQLNGGPPHLSAIAIHNPKQRNESRSVGFGCNKSPRPSDRSAVSATAGAKLLVRVGKLIAADIGDQERRRASAAESVSGFGV